MYSKTHNMDMCMIIILISLLSWNTETIHTSILCSKSFAMWESNY